MESQAIFAAGCFWGIEKAFLDVPGVLDAESGYIGGHIENPTYEQVCTGATGHAEAVRVTFDSAQVTYEALVRKFFTLHDPTQLNRQGPDVGSQYRSAVFYMDEDQKSIAESVANELAPNFFPKTIVTEITAATTFTRAEEYHQRYFENHPNATCHI
jgi:methionine-S-sulfoxide reductase|tara:strand:- start:294551 stop:295021 length:471 start_codon:yes stop_codon:yes gene_type:complete